MKFPFYQQPDSMDCGPSCLRMVAKYYGRFIPLQLLREKTQIGKEGVNLLGISEAAEAIGFRTHSVKLKYTSLLKALRLPAILHWNQNHFVVLYKIKRGKHYIADPAKGLLVFSKDEFLDHWTGHGGARSDEGIALLLEPSPVFYSKEQQSIGGPQQKAGNNLHFGNILRYLLPYRKLVVQLLIGLSMAGLLQLFLPFLTQSVVDTGINTANIHFVYVVLLAQLALFAGRVVIEFVRGWILLHISTRINISILTDYLIKLMKLPVSFFDSKHTGDILQRMNDHKRIESFLTGSSLNVLFSLINLIIFSVVLAVFHAGIFFVFLSASILYALWIVLFLKRRRILDFKRFEISAKEQSATIQLIQGMQEIKLTGAEKPMRWAWERLQAKLFGLNIENLSLSQWQQAGAFFINEGKNILVTFLSAKAVIDGQMTLGAMLAIQYIIGQLNSPIEQLVGFVQGWQNAKISMERLNEIHNMENEEPENQICQHELPLVFARTVKGGRAEGHQPMPARFVPDDTWDATGSKHFPDLEQSGNASIRFQGLTFTYPGAGNEPVLKNIDLEIPKGKTTAVVGVSGSGKTTLLKLLLKFYPVQQGDIRLGDISLSSISHKAWRASCGVVMQESFIFSDTIARNIAVGQEKIDMRMLQRAADLANLRSFIEALPQGFQTKIGFEGTGISMGQKQRILIARAIYRDPDFIFLDEATNSLDANNESEIIRNLNSFFTGRTVVVVAHRLSTVKNADQIIVLNKGMITERGTHQELISLRGGYYELVKNQLELGS